MATTLDLATELRPALDAADVLLEADRCVECGDAHAAAPCLLACPARVDVPAFVRALADDDPWTAAQTIFDANILGATCARVCPVEVLCEGACVLASEGRRPVAIGRLQRYATDWALEQGLEPRGRRAPTGRRVAVIGAGPAGLACAGELAAAGHHVTVVDVRREVGGLARFAIAPYRLDRDPLPAEARMLERLGVEFRLGVGIDSADALRALEAEHDAVVLAVGLGDDVELPLPGRELQGVWPSLAFVEALKTGLPPVVGSDVVVVGGGNTAIDMAREARRLGAQRVTVVYRRGEAEMPAYAHEVEEAREEGVEFRFLATPVRIRGEGWVDSVQCREMRLDVPDESGRRRPVEVPGSEFLLHADTVVLALGQQPRAELVSWIDGAELRDGRIVVDEEGRTGNRRYYAAGDAVGGTSVVEAVRDAKVVARALEAVP